MTANGDRDRAVLTSTLRIDALFLVTVSTVLLLVLPPRLSVTVLGGVGQPALLVGGLAGLLWLHGKLTGDVAVDRGPNPVRWALVAYLGYLCVNFTLLQTRHQTELERSSSIRYMILMFVLVGVALVVIDTREARPRLESLVRAAVYASGFGCAIVFVQFFLSYDPLPALGAIPGVQLFYEFEGIATRADLNRPGGIFNHPIEMGVVFGALVPLAIHSALHRNGRSGYVGWGLVAAIAACSLLAGSRSGVIAMLVGVSPLVLVWTWRQRANAAIAAVALIGVTWAAVPGLFGTFRWLFANLGADDSARARVDRFPAVIEVWREHPWFGRGAGTFTVEEGMLLDQQLYQNLIEFGVVGTLVTFLLIGTAASVTIAVWRSPLSSAKDRHLAMSLGGCVGALTITTLTYTAFWYRVHVSLLFLTIGALGALWRSVVRDNEAATSEEAPRAGHSGPGTLDWPEARSADTVAAAPFGSGTAADERVET